MTLSLAGFSSGDETDPRPVNNISLNLYGDASLLSVRYERLFCKKNRFFLSGNAGIGVDETTLGYSMGYNEPPEDYIISFPHHFTCNIGSKRHFFEIGIGGSFVKEKTGHQYLLYPLAGYRLQPLQNSRINFRLFAAIPVFGPGIEDREFNPVGISLGLCF